MAIEVFILQQEQQDADRAIAEIAITQDDMAEVAEFLHGAATSEGAKAAAPGETGLISDLEGDRAEAARNCGILLDAMQDVRIAHRDGDEIVRLTGGKPWVRDIVLGGIVRGIEAQRAAKAPTGQDIQPRTAEERITRLVMTADQYQQERARRRDEA